MQIFIKNKRIVLGSYERKQEAIIARKNAEKKFGLLPTPRKQMTGGVSEKRKKDKAFGKMVKSVMKGKKQRR